jgi:hypothetical protein
MQLLQNPSFYSSTIEAWTGIRKEAYALIAAVGKGSGSTLLFCLLLKVAGRGVAYRKRELESSL